MQRRCGDKASKPLTNLSRLIGKFFNDKFFALNKYFFLESKRDVNTKEICFRIDKCGAVGESLVHLCMLNGTTLCHEFAKRLINHFPKMLNDLYVSEIYCCY